LGDAKALHKGHNQLMNGSHQLSEAAGFGAIFIEAKFSMTAVIQAFF